MKKILVLIILLFGTYNLNAQIIEPRYEYGSALIGISEDLYQRDLIRKAEYNLLQLIDKFPENPGKDKYQLLLAHIDIKSGNYNVAKAKLSEFITERPNSPFVAMAAIWRGYVTFEQDNFKAAESDFHYAAELAKEQYDLRNKEIYDEIHCTSLYWEAISIIHQGSRLSDAELVFQKQISECPADMYADDALFGIGMVNEIQKNYDKAIDSYKLLAKQYPTSNSFIISRLHEANCHLVIKEPASALMVLENTETQLNHIQSGDSIGKTYEEQSNLKNIRERIHYLRGEASNTAGNYQKALGDYESFLDTYENSDLENAVRLSAGFSLLNLRRYDEALTYYDEIIEKAGTNEEMQRDKALLFRVVTLKRLGKTEESRIELMGLAAKPAYPYTGAALLELGQLYYEQADYTSARKTLERAISEAANIMEKERIQLLLASTYTQLKLWEDASEEYALAKKTAKETNILDMPDKGLYIAECSFGRGIALIQTKRSQEAIPELLEFLATPFKKNREDKANFWLAEAYYSMGMIQNAIENYKQVVDNYQSSSRREESLYSLGWSYFEQKRFKEASEIFETLTREFPKSRFVAEVWTRQGDAYYVQKDYTKAAEAYQKAARLAPGTEQGQYAAFQLCDALYRQKSYENAITALLNYVSKYSSSAYAPNALYLIGWIRFQEAKYEEAIDNFNYMITSYPNSGLVARAQYAIGDSYFNMGSYQSAMNSYQIVINKYPASNIAPEAMRGVQYCLVAMGRDEEAIGIIDNYVKSNIESPFVEDFEYKKGEMFFQRGRYTDAVSEYKNFLNKYPQSEKNAEALFYMGKSYDRVNDWKQAEQAFASIAKDYPDNEYASKALLELGLIKIKNTNIKAADSIFAIIRKKYSDTQDAAQAGFESAALAVQRGDTLRSIALYKEVAKGFPRHEFGIKSRFNLAQYYNSKNQNDSARYQLSFLTNIEEEPILAAEAQYRIGVLYARDKNYELAVEAFTRLTEKFPGVDDWYSYGMLGLGDALTELKLDEKAIEIYKALIEWSTDADFVNTAKSRMERLQKKIEKNTNNNKKR